MTELDTLTIHVKDITTRVHVGVSAEERATRQPLIVSTALHLEAGNSFQDRDSLAQTIDYDAIIGFIRDGLPALAPTQLIETVAERVVAFAFALSPTIGAVEVWVAKPGVLGADGQVSIVLTRSRP